MLLPIIFTFQIIKINIIGIALIETHHLKNIRKEMKALFVRVSSKQTSRVSSSFPGKKSDMLGQFYAKFYVDFDSKISFGRFDHGFICLKKTNPSILL